MLLTRTCELFLSVNYGWYCRLNRRLSTWAVRGYPIVRFSSHCPVILKRGIPQIKQWVLIHVSYQRHDD